MAQRKIQLDQENLSCSICLDLLKEPVTIPCGHSYCMSCIKNYWGEDEEKKTCSCPQCRQSFTPRPALVKSTMLHTLVEASTKLLENICPRHNEVIKIFCRTDQQCICILCSMDEHKGHDTVSAVAERAEKQKELGLSRQKIQQRIQDREKDVKVLQQEVEAINLSADEAVSNSDKTFTHLIQLIEKRRSEVKQQIRSQQETQVSGVKELEEKLQQEITELRRKDSGLEQLSITEDHLHFLNNYPSLSRLGEETQLFSITPQSPTYFKEVTAAVSEARDKLQAVLNEEGSKVSGKITRVEVSLLQREPQTRAEFWRYSKQIILDSNTAHTRLSLSDRNRKVTFMSEDQSYPSHPDRFTRHEQVLSPEGLTGRCYWEVEWSGNVSIAVVYKKTGTVDQCAFGYDDKSWSLQCYSGSYYFTHNGKGPSISGPPSSRIGVYLDHRAGTLSFYKVTETMTLLHRVQTTFTQPLHPGFWFWSSCPPGSTAELCELQ